MKENLVTVISASDSILVINVPELNLHRTWNKRGMRYLFDRDVLEQAFYSRAVENMFRSGELVTDDKQFLQDVGLMDEEEHMAITALTTQVMMRMIKNMPVYEFRQEIKKLSPFQIQELADFAIIHHNDLAMDRVDILTQASGKKILRAIENLKAAEEE